MDIDVSDDSLKADILHSDLRKYLESPHLDPSTRLQNERLVLETQEVVRALIEEFLDKFPKSQLWPKEIAVSAQCSLEIVLRAVTVCEDLYRNNSGHPLELAWPTKLLSFVGVMEWWIKRNPSPIDILDGPTPTKLREFTIDTIKYMIIQMRRELARNDFLYQNGTTIKSFLLECHQSLNDIIDRANATPFSPFNIIFFSSPRIPVSIDPFSSTDAKTTLAFESIADITNNSISILHILSSTAIAVPISNNHQFIDLQREISTCACLVFEHCGTSVLSRAQAIQAQTMERLLRAIGPFLSNSASASVIQPHLQRLLFHRISRGPKPEWSSVDACLAHAFEITTYKFSSVSTPIAIVEQLSNVDGGEDLKGAAAVYILRSIPFLTRPTLLALSVSPGIQNLAPNGRLLEAVNRRLMSFSDSKTPPKKRKWDDGADPKTKIERALCDLLSVAQDDLGVDPMMPDNEWVSILLNNLENWVQRSQRILTNASRTSCINVLSWLPCSLVHPDSQKCSAELTNQSPSFRLITIYIRLCTSLCEGANPNDRSNLWKMAYACLSRAFAHGSVESDYTGAFEVLRTGFIQEMRPIRMAAGKAAAGLTSHFKLHKKAARGTKIICDMLEQILAEDNAKFKETCIITLGHVGRATDLDGLGSVVSSLISQFGQPHPIFQAVSYVQLLELSRHHGKAPFALLSPYIQEISRYTTARICSQPSYLTETCRFVGRTLPDFLELTLIHTLPMLVAYRSKEALTAVSRQLEMSICTMIIPHTSDILSFILMLENPSKTDKAFQFLSSLIEEESGKSVSVQMLLKGHRIEVITSLVIAMADEDADRADSAANAIRKLQRLLTTPKSKPPSSADSSRDFLLPFCLGILSNMNTAITNARGMNAAKQKRQIIRSLGVMIQKVGSTISSVSPQIMAMLQTMIHATALVQETLNTWHIFLTTSNFQDIGPYAGSTTAAIIAGWAHFDTVSRDLAKAIIEYLLLDNGNAIGHYLSELVSLDGIPELSRANSRFIELQRSWNRKQLLSNLLERSVNENIAVSARSLSELKQFMVKNNEMLQKASSGDAFEWPTGDIVRALLRSASRDGEGCEDIRGLAFECMGVLGALDPDRLDIGADESTITILNNYEDQSENTKFVLHLIQDVLVGAYRSANDMSYQHNLAYALQELLRFCEFTSDLVVPSSRDSVNPRVRQRWASLPQQVVETVAALLGGRLRLSEKEPDVFPLPIFPSVPTYRQWIQRWTQHLIARVSGAEAKSIFDVFRNIARNQDVSIAHHILPHLVLHVVISGGEVDREMILNEILAVLEDKIPLGVVLSPDRRLLSAQTVFLLMDHMNKWIRRARHDLAPKRGRSRPTATTALQHHLAQVESMLTGIDHGIMARAAFECKAYARALMNFEHQVLLRQQVHTTETELQPYYERLHQIYAHLDEPDGMQGVSSKVVAPSLEHQIREHESTGRWTSAQSCWEIKLQQKPDDVNLHVGLLRCLRNLGHYDTLRTHIRGVLSRNTDWFDTLAGFQVEGSWMAGDWDGVAEVVRKTNSTAPEVHIGRLLLAIKAGDVSSIPSALAVARRYLGAPITAAGKQSYRRSYDAVIHLHQVRELEMIHQAAVDLKSHPSDGGHRDEQGLFANLTAQLSSRFDASLPTFRAREPILSMRRTAFAICYGKSPVAEKEIGMTWLASAKIARKSGHSQTAYSATLQASQMSTPFAFIQSSKLTKASGESPRALQELEAAIQRTSSPDDVDETEHTKMMAKALLLRARWKDEADRFDEKDIGRSFAEATSTLKSWESPYFYLGRFYDVLRERSISSQPIVAADRARLVCKHYIEALSWGSKYIFQTMPRLLTLWLDITEDQGKGLPEAAASHIQSAGKRINILIEGALKTLPVYQWFTAFPQIVSRIEHPDEVACGILFRLVADVIREYPQQALWLFTTVGLSKRPTRKSRGDDILDQVKGSPPSNSRSSVKKLVNQWEAMSKELLNLCNFPVDHEPTLPMSKFPNLTRLVKSDLILPLQSSMTVSLPSSSSREEHQPFPSFLPTIRDFGEEVEIMKSLQKPRKITITGSDGRSYNWLCKPKDDMRKDARLMDFNGIINKLLKTNSESRRRQLHIRTYSVIPLNEECGLIEWVPNTIGLRFALVKHYDTRGINLFPKNITEEYERARERGDKHAAKSFIEHTLPQYPPVFHEWFIATFSEPTAWFASRLAYGRTAAVMSMVGYILGLGDRHGENILFDSTTGDAVHVDFNCLFEKGKTFAVPEKVPFRLTQNLVDGLGVTGVEGVFRIACEVTMDILRDNKDSLMSVLEAFVHDPLVEWEVENRNAERRNRGAGRSRRDAAPVNPADQMKALAHQSLAPIRRKLEGLLVGQTERAAKEIKTSNQVEALIKEATDPINLATMYFGWAPWL